MVNEEEAKVNGEGGGARKGREEGRERKQWGATMTCPIPSISSPPPQINLRNNNQLTIATQEEVTLRRARAVREWGGGRESMSNGARQCAVALIASLRSPPALRISNQLTMATGETTIKSHGERKGGGRQLRGDWVRRI